LFSPTPLIKSYVYFLSLSKHILEAACLTNRPKRRNNVQNLLNIVTVAWAENRTFKTLNNFNASMKLVPSHCYTLKS